MKIMYVSNNPEQADPLQIEQEVQELQESLERNADSEPIVFRVFSALPVERLAETVRREQPDILHFSAHGEEGALVLGHAELDVVEVDGPRLAGLLSGCPKKPKLIVLNACSSNQMAASLAAAGGADFVIGTDAPIMNAAARAMVTTLYQQLANAASIAQAFRVACANLHVISGGATNASLHAMVAPEGAEHVCLVDPFRIVACFPMVEKWLDHSLQKPDTKFRPEMPEVQFGIAGAPVAARQTVFFTDDESVRDQGNGLESARSWIIESQPVDGEIWLDSYYAYYGEMNWFAAVTTTDGKVVSAASKMTTALVRYYLEEQWRGTLPDEIDAVVRRAIGFLVASGGGRRGRGALPR
ncbi:MULTISPECIES: CHAT domain-containing protein [Sphingobium]|uniref:CHAT domain-containing protein n=1 Tax=Sphingobium TaxID=165695 RepID=UPI0015EB6F99|nr:MULTISPECIES: CHAT domain-containing protein [Sphingobium]MCW2363170.1 hypothetical protein [Sphingobium sp. B10D3B]MCW2400150.1 hypothetical protein [Sphingobium sp. B10D7B]MCW2407128.1 hypothetical protein [Sphingobium xanthum]